MHNVFPTKTKEAYFCRHIHNVFPTKTKEVFFVDICTTFSPLKRKKRIFVDIYTTFSPLKWKKRILAHIYTTFSRLKRKDCTHTYSLPSTVVVPSIVTVYFISISHYEFDQWTAADDTESELKCRRLLVGSWLPVNPVTSTEWIQSDQFCFSAVWSGLKCLPRASTGLAKLCLSILTRDPGLDSSDWIKSSAHRSLNPFPERQLVRWWCFRHELSPSGTWTLQGMPFINFHLSKYIFNFHEDFKYSTNANVRALLWNLYDRLSM